LGEGRSFTPSVPATNLATPQQSFHNSLCAESSSERHLRWPRSRSSLWLARWRADSVSRAFSVRFFRHHLVRQRVAAELRAAQFTCRNSSKPSQMTRCHALEVFGVASAGLGKRPGTLTAWDCCSRLALQGLLWGRFNAVWRHPRTNMTEIPRPVSRRSAEERVGAGLASESWSRAAAQVTRTKRC
jgi:hypothetical protein